ncbi:MAG: LuxR C-terminal-related transcriptional regulator [Pseudomonadota bacterium]
MFRPEDTSTMSRRELQVARAYTSGQTYRQIADDLHIAPATVRTHINNIYRKLEVSSKIELLQRMDGVAVRPASPRRRWIAPLAALLMAAGVAAVVFLSLPSARPLPDMRGLAVVVFSDDGDAATRDLLSRDLIDGLTKHTELFVIQPSKASRALSQAAYARQLSESLNMRFILTGSANTEGNLWEVSASLFDRNKGGVIWSDLFRGTRHDSLSLRLPMLESLEQVVHLPSPGPAAARCLEMSEHLTQSASGAPVGKMYQFQALGPRYCPVDMSGPR